MKIDSLFKKKDTKVAEEQVVEETNQSIKSKSFSFTELAYQEYNSHVEPLRQEIKSLEERVRELWNTIENEQKKNADTRVLKETHKKLAEKLHKKRKEFPGLQVKYEVNFELTRLARELDGLEASNKGVDLYHILGRKINEVMSILVQIESCYSEFYTPPNLDVIKSLMIGGVVTQMNAVLPRLHKKNRQELEKKFFERFEKLNAEKERVQELSEKYEEP